MVTTHLPTLEGRKAELVKLADPTAESLPTEWPPVTYRSGAGQGKSPAKDRHHNR